MPENCKNRFFAVFKETLYHDPWSPLVPLNQTTRLEEVDMSFEHYANKTLEEKNLETIPTSRASPEHPQINKNLRFNPYMNENIASPNKATATNHSDTNYKKFSNTNLQQQNVETFSEKLTSHHSSWKPPRSPHNLIEEFLYQDPWSLLVATIFLNKTNCTVARHHLLRFLQDHRSPRDVLDKSLQDLEKYFVGVGLQRTRALQLYRMSYDFLFKKWTSVVELYGIGHYGECAFRMFCLGDFSVEPKDRYLRIYKGWYEKVGAG
ncbi:unnamed protein product [Phaedon cochleariae]|uniref:Methyl-CpG-binding domain protein 4-like protein n=1 Tax=Phaedon cochleariae TaxID=80249 RepID=A0A9N9X3X8_PHACE|nr:unnamed protein product [Phaedon cochleariae]